MRIVFCGTPDYAVPSLQRLLALAPAHEVVAIVSQPDKPKGRSKTPTPPPVVEAALKLNFPRGRIFQPRSINKPEVLDALRALAPDLLCVVAYGGLLKQPALELARLYPINAHGSILPRHRGAAPIQAALLAGDPDTGVCIMKMELGLDTGPVLLCRTTPIGPMDDAGTLHDRLAALSADCFVAAVEQIAAGRVTFTPQDHARATYATKLEKNTGLLDWAKPAAYLERFIRAMNPWPGAWTLGAAKDGGAPVRLRVIKASVAGALTAAGGQPTGQGTWDGEAVVVTCGDGQRLRLEQVQPEGRKAMSFAEFVRGAGRAFTSVSLWSRPEH